MKLEVRQYIRQCNTWAALKKPIKTPRAPLGTIKVGAPWDVVATDYLETLPVTPRGNKYILVLSDYFTKCVEIIAVPDQTAETCASKILNEFISRRGCPLSILSDQGRNCESKVFRELCRMLQIRNTRTCPHNRKCNGQVERFNHTLKRMIKAYLCEDQNDLDLNLSCLASAYRSTPNESNGLTPNLLAMGREVRLPAEVVFGSSSWYDQTDITSYGDYVDVLRYRMQRAHQVAREHLKSAAQCNKSMYDVSMVLNNYKPGDAVWILSESSTVGAAHKLGKTYLGPYVITRNLSNVNFEVQLEPSEKKKVVHHDKLKLYEGADTPAWILKARRKLQKN